MKNFISIKTLIFGLFTSIELLFLKKLEIIFKSDTLNIIRSTEQNYDGFHTEKKKREIIELEGGIVLSEACNRKSIGPFFIRGSHKNLYSLFLSQSFFSSPKKNNKKQEQHKHFV